MTNHQPLKWLMKSNKLIGKKDKSTYSLEYLALIVNLQIGCGYHMLTMIIISLTFEDPTLYHPLHINPSSHSKALKG